MANGGILSGNFEKNKINGEACYVMSNKDLIFGNWNKGIVEN